MSMILDPTGDGLEVFYDNKLRNLIGSPEKCINWVIEVSCDKLIDGISDTIGDTNNKFNYKGEIWEQFSEFYLDINGFGRVYADIIDKIGINFEKLDVKKVKL